MGSYDDLEKDKSCCTEYCGPCGCGRVMFGIFNGLYWVSWVRQHDQCLIQILFSSEVTRCSWLLAWNGALAWDSFRYFNSSWRMATNLTSTQTASIIHDRDAGTNLGHAANNYFLFTVHSFLPSYLHLYCQALNFPLLTLLGWESCLYCVIFSSLAVITVLHNISSAN